MTVIGQRKDDSEGVQEGTLPLEEATSFIGLKSNQAVVL